MPAKMPTPAAAPNYKNVREEVIQMGVGLTKV